MIQIFNNETPKKGEIPIMLTPTARHRLAGTGKSINTLGDFPAAAVKVARDEKVLLLDFNAFTALMFDFHGLNESKKLFPHFPKNTFPWQVSALAYNSHFSTYGAYLIAKCVLEEIIRLGLNLKEIIIDLDTFYSKLLCPAENLINPLSPNISFY